ncbi:MAG TPA: helix-turn-helix transcriptional regulator [Candidatus Limnocylindria bacterium]|jgi:FixJ family two-component response regulator|nr:helix-turn-helix transcriptional regulator [Candidatus Limnocylindria bacterium]
MSPLSQRETQVLDLVRAGHTTKEISAQLGISTSTVIWHRKLALARQTAAAAPTRHPSARTTPTTGPISASAVRELTIAGPKAAATR